jgi:uncharacterized membrane protein YdjX (TVP38/TMEM64 family)
VGCIWCGRIPQSTSKVRVFSGFPTRNFPRDLTVAWDTALERTVMRILQNPLPSDLRLLRSTVEYHMTDNYWPVFWSLTTTYVFLQAFAIPGPAILAILMAGLYGGWVGGALSMVCSVFGSSVCYFIFKVIGKPILDKYFSTRLASLRSQISAQSDNLPFFFLFLRVTPIVPNFFINISSGNLGIPYGIFLFGTILGLLPNAVILSRIGVELATLQDENGTGLQFDIYRAMGLVGIGLLALLPIILKKRFKPKMG